MANPVKINVNNWHRHEEAIFISNLLDLLYAPVKEHYAPIAEKLSRRNMNLLKSNTTYPAPRLQSYNLPHIAHGVLPTLNPSFFWHTSLKKEVQEIIKKGEEYAEEGHILGSHFREIYRIAGCVEDLQALSPHPFHSFLTKHYGKHFTNRLAKGHRLDQQQVEAFFILHRDIVELLNTRLTLNLLQVY
jgi:hypothetical protein